MNNMAFEELPLPRKELAPNAVHAYRVYKDADNFVVIQAQTALEALQNSKCDTVCKIERDTVDFSHVLDPTAWPKAAPAADAAAGEKPAAEAAAAAPPADAAAPPAGEAAKA